MLISSNCVHSCLSVPLPLVTLEVQVGQESLSRCYSHYRRLCSQVIAHTQRTHPIHTHRNTWTHTLGYLNICKYTLYVHVPLLSVTQMIVAFKDETYLGVLGVQGVQWPLVVLEVQPETLLLYPCLLSHPRLPSHPSLLEALQGAGLRYRKKAKVSGLFRLACSWPIYAAHQTVWLYYIRNIMMSYLVDLPLPEAQENL